jgi:hypothetical protein
MIGIGYNYFANMGKDEHVIHLTPDHRTLMVPALGGERGDSVTS